MLLFYTPSVVCLSLSSSSPFLGLSGFLFVSTFHIYRLCYTVSLCICLGQLISGYGLAKGFYVVLLSTLDLSSMFICILVLLVSVWYPITWLFWLYMTLRPGALLSSFLVASFGGLVLPNYSCLFWSWLLLFHFYVLFVVALFFM